MNGNDLNPTPPRANEPSDPPAAPPAPKPPVEGVDPSGQPVPPPAARAVLSGKAQEGQSDLQGELQKKLRDRELRVMQLEDENRTLKTARETPKPTPKVKRGSGWSFFDPEEED